MPLSASESVIYQNVLEHVTKITLNLMAVKVENHPGDFNGWCRELIDVCLHRINRDLLDEHQFKPLKKIVEILKNGVSVNQLRMATIAPWPFYASFLNEQFPVHAFAERQKMLEYLAQLKSTPLAQMSNEDRLAFAGKHTATHNPVTYDFDVEWFASTKTAKAFHTLLAEHPESLDKALEHIPLEGDVNESDYLAFVTEFKKAFTLIDEVATLAPATRLLAVRRSDQFVALTNSKTDLLTQGMNIARLSKADFEGYWSYLIVNIRNCPWWRQPMPDVSEEQFLWHHRAILLDMLFYADQTTPESSNYFKRVNKPTKANAGTGSIRNGRKTPEEMVDIALAADDMPEYIINKRNSIIIEVKKGKKVEDVISMMRMIFG